MESTSRKVRREKRKQSDVCKSARVGVHVEIPLVGNTIVEHVNLRIVGPNSLRNSRHTIRQHLHKGNIVVRELCDERGLTLIFDEVWTGCGRTGKWFAHQHFRGNAAKPQAAGESAACAVEPDIMTLGKAVGGGLPVGVMYAKPDLAKLLVPGTHGCTLGGNPICMAVARTIFDVIESEKLVDHAASLGELAFAKLRNDPKLKDRIVEVRGHGLMIGIQLKNAPEQFLQKALARGLVINLTAKQVVRLAPPINITEAEWRTGLDAVADLIASL